MVAAGLSPVLAGRSATRLAELADELAAAGPAGASVTWQAADVDTPATVHALVTDPSDVLVSTVGPFTALGDPAISAAIRAGAAYVDSTGEPPFIERVFTDYHRQALVRGAHLLTAFGYDYVPGNLAGALAIKQARENGTLPVRVEIGYFVKGAFAMSSGTRASSAGVMFAPSFAFHHGRVQSERAAKSTSSFFVDGRPLDGLSVGGSEHFALPRLDSALLDVGVYLGWAGSARRPPRAPGPLSTQSPRSPAPAHCSPASPRAPPQGPPERGRMPSSAAAASRLPWHERSMDPARSSPRPGWTAQRPMSSPLTFSLGLLRSSQPRGPNPPGHSAPRMPSASRRSLTAAAGSVSNRWGRNSVPFTSSAGTFFPITHRIDSSHAFRTWVLFPDAHLVRYLQAHGKVNGGPHDLQSAS